MKQNKKVNIMLLQNRLSIHYVNRNINGIRKDLSIIRQLYPELNNCPIDKVLLNNSIKLLEGEI